MPKKVEVSGLYSDGNAFVMLAKCHKAARKAGWSESKWRDFQSEAKSGDFDHLVQTVMKSFTEKVDDDG